MNLLFGPWRKVWSLAAIGTPVGDQEITFLALGSSPVCKPGRDGRAQVDFNHRSQNGPRPPDEFVTLPFDGS
jgi:hypothetical protein